VVGDWEVVLLARTCGGEAGSGGGRWLEHQGGGEKERIEEGLKERKEGRKPGTVNALRAAKERIQVSVVKASSSPTQGEGSLTDTSHAYNETDW